MFAVPKLKSEGLGKNKTCSVSLQLSIQDSGNIYVCDDLTAGDYFCEIYLLRIKKKLSKTGVIVLPFALI